MTQNKTLKTLWGQDTAQDFTYLKNTKKFPIQFLDSNNQPTSMITTNYSIFFMLQLQPIINGKTLLISNIPLMLWIYKYKNANTL